MVLSLIINKCENKLNGKYSNLKLKVSQNFNGSKFHITNHMTFSTKYIEARSYDYTLEVLFVDELKTKLNKYYEKTPYVYHVENFTPKDINSLTNTIVNAVVNGCYKE